MPFIDLVCKEKWAAHNPYYMIKACSMGMVCAAGQIYCKALFAAFTLACHPQTLGDLLLHYFPPGFF